MAKSEVSSLIDLYNSIAAANFGGATRPTLFMGQAAQTTSAAAQQRVPYVVLFDDGFKPEYESSAGGREMGRIRLEVYATSLDAASGITVDSIVRGIKYGGSTPAAKLGFDWGTFSFTAGVYLYKIHLKRVLERRSYAGFDQDGARVHKCELHYECIAGIPPS